jgi:hypothetical protein
MLLQISLGGSLSLKRLCVRAGGRSPQEDSAVNDRCQPVEKRGETRVPARSRTSSKVEHARSIDAGSRRENPPREGLEAREALRPQEEMAWRRVAHHGEMRGDQA